MGDFYDAVAGYGPFSFTTVGLGVAAYHTSFLMPEQYRHLFILIGAVGAVANVYMRLVHQKYLNCYFAGKKYSVNLMRLHYKIQKIKGVLLISESRLTRTLALLVCLCLGCL